VSDGRRPEHPQERAERERDARYAVMVAEYVERSDERLRRRRDYLRTHRVWNLATDRCEVCGRDGAEIHFGMLPCVSIEG
jgi:hypothetical protein